MQVSLTVIGPKSLYKINHILFALFMFFPLPNFDSIFQKYLNESL